MSTKMEAAPHVAKYGSIVSSLTGRKSFIGSQMARHEPVHALPQEENGPQMNWIRQLYEHMPDAVFFMSSKNRISACNRAAVTLFGYEEEELLDGKIDLVWSSTPGVQLRGRWADRGAVRAGLATTKAGVQFPASLTVIREQDEREPFAAAIFEDFRTERETLQQVQELQGELARLARIVALGEMTATLAHELSQPLSSITAYSEGCERLVTDDRRRHGGELREALSEITHHALWAGTIVQNIREFARYGTVDKRLEAMHTLIPDATTLALAGAFRKGLHIDLQLEAERDIVLADRVQIIQVLTNLIRNSVEATDGVEQPSIEIHTRIDDFSQLIVDVSDNGCGIATEIEEALFRPFVTSKPRGLGMGLALSKRIIEAHGGHIRARKGLQCGAILSFSLPLVEAAINGE
ncbi:two-component system sensor kinase FixL [Rhizobium sp. BK529]|uniref:PAS domain-containing sensor histidine kinase n=1 Tax=unclassified Rhizobium TaxID=2613769 RepID=UPI00104B88A6|nr:MULTISPECIES: ATP-binding protein [unclassified Rhizobium]MBB3593684.1 two-component system sensor kinase FixL [Rhizobium sp. BK529]TCS03472.1 two-component system sensor kinase FixL [Rhizobium sp. BK418]